MILNVIAFLAFKCYRFMALYDTECYYFMAL